MSRKIKKKTVEAQLHMRGNAEIEKWAEAALDIPDPEDAKELEQIALSSEYMTLEELKEKKEEMLEDLR